MNVNKRRNRRKLSGESILKQENDVQDPLYSEQKNKYLLFFRSLLQDKSNRFLVHLLCTTIAVIAVIGMLFFRINIVHNRNVAKESSQHLKEISNQIKLYIEESIAIDWRVAQSVGDSILRSTYVNDDSVVFDMLQKKQTIWGVSNLMLYTANGYGIYSDGSTEVNDVVSRTVYHARKQGKYLSFIDSRLIFAVPLDTTLTFHGEKIVAISVVHDMSSFLDNMELSSFNEAAWVYLTNQDGVIISALNGPNSIQGYNIQAIIHGMDIMPLEQSHTSADFLLNMNTEVFRISNGSTNLYCVSAPITTGDAPMNLFYFVPENVVNNILSGFSQQLMILSMVIIALFAAGAFSVFLFLYKSRKRVFDRAIQKRERMFDLLVKNTRTSFGLFTVGKPQPEYQSANVSEIIADSYWVLDKTDRFYIYNDKRIATDNIALVNEALQEWDGKSTFKSGYLCNAQNMTKNYFIFELYPVNNGTSEFVAIAQDVTSLYVREEAVKNAMESVKQANDAKTRFLFNMSHDIRTPMNAIMNMSNFALESMEQPSKLADYLHVIHESAEHLLHLVNDVLDMSHIESGQLSIAFAPFKIREELQRQVDIIQPLSDAKNQNLITDFAGLKNTLVSGDALKLSQIINNLLSNAIKFTPEKGTICFIAKELPSIKDTMVTVRLSVEDTGFGISNEDIQRIFIPFQRSNDKEVSRIEGTGLGLAITKNYIEAMGGTVRCESILGEGSTFIVELFFQKAELSGDTDNSHADVTETRFQGMHALVAEDNHINQIIAKEMLKRVGFALTIVNDGSIAVEKFLESKPDTYDVIYMDIQMPNMDGLTAATQIRASNHLQAKTIPIIAMTANAFAEDIEKARMAGMDGYVAKPIVLSTLVDETIKAIENKRGEAQ